jgi:hypothetical protein
LFLNQTITYITIMFREAVVSVVSIFLVDQ